MLHRLALMLIMALLGSIVTAGCEPQGPSPSPSLQPQALRPGEVRALPVANWILPDGRTLLCAGGGHVQTGWTLRGSADDPRLAWMVEPDGRRAELAFAPGWTARFTPLLEVLDPAGAIVARDGAEIAAHCSTADPSVVFPGF